MGSTTDNQNAHKHVPDMLKLVCFEGPNADTEYSKPGSSLTIGRTKASKIWVKDPSVSEKHGRLEWSGQAWILSDVGSSNGTKVNGNALTPEGDGVELKDGDVIQLGEQSKLNVQIAPVLEKSMTVEQFLRGEASRIEMRLSGKLEQMANQLLEDWETAKHQLLSAAVEV